MLARLRDGSARLDLLQIYWCLISLLGNELKKGALIFAQHKLIAQQCLPIQATHTNSEEDATW